MDTFASMIPDPDDQRSALRLIHEELAKDPGTSPQVLVTLANSEWASVRELVAANPSTPEECLNRLVGDELASVRHAGAANPAASVAAAIVDVLGGGEDRVLPS